MPAKSIVTRLKHIAKPHYKKMPDFAITHGTVEERFPRDDAGAAGPVKKCHFHGARPVNLQVKASDVFLFGHPK